jgi:spore coat polysaccharide biosynthesis protein SpsF
MPIASRPLLGHVVGRLEMLQHVHKVVVATSDLIADELIASWCGQEGIACFRGSEDDVLARYVGAARQFHLSSIVRLTADNPFTDMAELDRLIDLHKAMDNDFSQSFAGLPIGVGAEIFSFEALCKSERDGRLPHHREHVDEYMIENPQFFRSGSLTVEGPKNRPDVRLTVDTAQDYERACFIAENSRGKWVTTEEAIILCSRFA